MRKILVPLLFTITFLSCSEWQNDLFVEDISHEDDNDAPAVTPDGQLYNMNFDLWSKDGINDVCYGSSASPEQKTVWGSANSTTSLLGKQTCVPERSFTALSGAGKCAVKLETQLILNTKLAAGNFFTGQMGAISLATMNASLKWGIPFTFRPTALEGYACYKPSIINKANSPYENKIGSVDNGHVFVLLTDWDKQFIVDPAENSFVDIDNDPKIIGYGKVTFDHSMAGYEKFTINIDYRSVRTPKYVVIVASSSALGDYFTGGTGSTLYLDEFKFLY
jgi:hypothetical protein